MTRLRLELALLPLLVACGSTSPEHWAITHLASQGESRGDCAIESVVEDWTAVGELHVLDSEVLLIVEGVAYSGPQAEPVDVSFSIEDASEDYFLELSQRYQLDLGARSGTAITVRTEERAGNTVEDCVTEVPLTLARVE